MTNTAVGTPRRNFPLAAAARKRGCKTATLRNAIARKRLPATKLGRDWFVSLDELDAYLKTRWQRRTAR